MKPSPKILLILTLACGAAGWWLGRGGPLTRPSAASAAEKTAGVAGATLPPAPPLTGADSTHDKALLELLTLKPKDYPDRLRQAFRQGNHDEIKWLAERWAARDPASLLAFMRAPDGLGFRIDYWPDWTITQACFGAWFRRDLPAALAAMEGLSKFSASEGRMMHGVWQVILPTLMTLDPARGLRFIGDHPDFAGGVIWSRKEYRNLASLAVSMPECAGRKPIFTCILQAFLSDPDLEKGQESGLAWLGKLDPAVRLEAVPDLSYVDREALPKIREMLRKSFPPADLAALDQKAKEAGGKVTVETLALLRALQDPKAAMDWAASLNGRAKFTAMSSILEVSAPENPGEAAVFLESFPAGPLHDRALATLSEKLRSAGGAKAAADWLVSLPDARDAKTEIPRLVGNWALNQPGECAVWVSALPSGPLRLEAAAAAVDGSGSVTAILEMAARLPEGLGVEALKRAWSGRSSSDSRPLAEAAARQPEGAIRELAMAKASRDARSVFNGFNQAWLDWAAALPTPADRAAAWRGAEEIGGRTRWDEGIREKARQQLGGVTGP